MFEALPKDIVWLIIKLHLNDILRTTLLHESLFYSRRVNNDKTMFEKTHRGEQETLLYGTSYLVDWLYPLRLICKRMNNLCKEKITKVVNDPTTKFMLRIAM